MKAPRNIPEVKARKVVAIYNDVRKSIIVRKKTFPSGKPKAVKKKVNYDEEW